jgi:NitT/TauT family transport system permease protein/sulfonate transport system permease protein
MSIVERTEMSEDSVRRRRQPSERAEVEFRPTAAEIDPVGYFRTRRLAELGLAVGVPALLLALWQLAASQDWIDTRFFPAPSTIVSTAKELIDSGELQHDVFVSVRRVLFGFALGVLSGTVAGTAMGMSRWLRAAFEPLLDALYTVPKLAMLPLLLMIFGVGDTPKILLIAITVFFFMWIASMAAVMAVPGGYREAIRSLGAGRWSEFRHVLFPAALPQIFVAMRVSAGVSVLVLVGAEFVQGNDGIGHLIWFSWSLFIARRMYVGIVVVAVLGLLFAMLIQAIPRRIVPWASEDELSGGRGRS